MLNRFSNVSGLCASPQPGHRFPVSMVFVPVPSQDIDFQCHCSLCLSQARTLAWDRHKDHWHWKSMSWVGTGTKTTDIGNLCPGLGQAQRTVTLKIYVLAWDRHKDHWHWKFMSWLGTGDIGGIVDHHCLKFILKNNFLKWKRKKQSQNTTLWEQFQNPIEKQKIPLCRSSSKIHRHKDHWHWKFMSWLGTGTDHWHWKSGQWSLCLCQART
jgi:hypothetical protein